MNLKFDYIKTDKLLVVKIIEEIDHHTTEKIRRKIDNEITRYMPRKVILDFNKVSFMDSAGIGMIIGRYTSKNDVYEQDTIKRKNNVFNIFF